MQGVVTISMTALRCLERGPQTWRLVDRKLLLDREMQRAIAVDDGDAIVMAQRLAAELGLAVGISSGANFLGAVIAQDRLGPEAVVATVFADSNKKYLSTDLLREEPLKADFISRRIALRDVRALPRHCDFCPPEVRRQR